MLYVRTLFIMLPTRASVNADGHAQSQLVEMNLSQNFEPAQLKTTTTTTPLSSPLRLPTDPV
jgi:hypothetical protein